MPAAHSSLFAALLLALLGGAFALGWQWERCRARRRMNEQLRRSADALEAAEFAIRELHATALQMREGVEFWRGRARDAERINLHREGVRE